ncbi:MAG: hypothetical protein ONB46_19125 [candidate division KSB1 bacterium]|nr:hypothetical protein [candidate division KSB1 bacterium]MDZ7368032.1 hypothetical protein [candidate division KSB1 bacterium]
MSEFSDESVFRAASFGGALAAPKMKLPAGLLEILRAARYAISLRLLSIQLLAFAPGYLLYLIFTYASLLLSGRSLAAGWAQSGLMPCLFAGGSGQGNEPSLAALIVFGLGVVGLGTAFLLANLAGSRLLWMKRRSTEACSIREAYDFAFAKFNTVVLALAAIILVIALLAGGGALVGLIGRIPYLGQIVVTGLAWLWLLASLVALFLLAMAALIFALAPAMVATTGENALEAGFQVAAIVWTQPWRLLLYLAAVLMTASIGLLVVAFCVKRAFLLLDGLFAVTMGNEYQNLSTQAQHLLQKWIRARSEWFADSRHWASHFFFSRPIAPLELSPWLEVLAHTLALSLLFSAAWVLAYPLAIINSGLALTYLVLRRIKDGENFLERCQADESTPP